MDLSLVTAMSHCLLTLGVKANICMHFHLPKQSPNPEMTQKAVMCALVGCSKLFEEPRFVQGIHLDLMGSYHSLPLWVFQEAR